MAAVLGGVLMTLHVIVMVTDAIKSSTVKEGNAVQYAPAVIIKKDSAGLEKFISGAGDSPAIK